MSGRNVFLKYEEEQPNESGESSKPSHPLNYQFRQTLNQIFPPLATTENGKLIHLQVSTKEAAIFEILDLENILQVKLKEIRNGIQGFSPQISQVHHQLFQELIRQETIACPERGQLLKWVFDETVLAVRALGKCTKSAFSNAVCKKLLSRRSILGMRGEIPKLERRLQEAGTLAEGMQRERKESLSGKEDVERVKTIEYEFLENQLERANQEMIKQYEDIIDKEHRWLKDPNN